MSETPLIDATLLTGSAKGWRLFRQNTGVGWVGKLRSKKAGTVILDNARVLHAGLCVGSSDVIGLRPVVITADMVGQTIGQFVAAEIKTPGVPVTKEQAGFIEMVKRLNGHARIVRDVADID